MDLKFLSGVYQFFKKKQIGLALAFILLLDLENHNYYKYLLHFNERCYCPEEWCSTQDVGVFWYFGVIALTIGGLLAGL
jgi:hypothetical protein